MALPDLSSRIVYAWPWALQEGVGLENLKPSTPEQSPYIGQAGGPLRGWGMWGVPEIGGPPISISFHIIEVLGGPLTTLP